MKIEAKEISMKQNNDGTYNVLVSNDGYNLEIPRAKINLDVEAHTVESENKELFRLIIE